MGFQAPHAACITSRWVLRKEAPKYRTLSIRCSPSEYIYIYTCAHAARMSHPEMSGPTKFELVGSVLTAAAWGFMSLLVGVAPPPYVLYKPSACMHRSMALL